MKVFIIILAIFSFNTFANQVAIDKSQAIVKKENKKTKYNFRKTIWGMNQKEVKLQEKGKPDYTTKDALGYQNKTVLNLDTIVLYIFASNKLVRGKYIITQKYSNKNRYIIEYNNIKTKLIKKYGKEKEDKVFWLNNLYKNQFQDWGMAISVGHLMYYATWSTKDTDITISLSGENYKIKLEMEYRSKKLKKLEEKKKEKEDMNDL